MNFIICIFSVSEGLLFLHDNLICHGNLCPSNVIIDCAKQFYVCDFGLYHLKRLYVEPDELFEKLYKDPKMNENSPDFYNDVYSFGVLVCHVLFYYYNKDKDKKFSEFLYTGNFDIFPPFFGKLIKQCLSPDIEARPTFRRIIQSFQTTDCKVANLMIKDFYREFTTIKYLLKLSKNNDLYSLYKLGKNYEEKKDHQMAMKYFKKAADLGYSNAQAKYGAFLYAEGKKEIGEKKNKLIKDGADYLLKAARQGSALGLNNYGVVLSSGNGIQINIKESEICFKKSADLDLAYGQVNYGRFLMTYDPTPERIKNGLYYIKKAISQVCPYAYHVFGVLLQKGQGVEKNINLAAKNFQFAASLGYSDQSNGPILKFTELDMPIENNQQILNTQINNPTEKNAESKLQIINKLPKNKPTKIKKNLQANKGANKNSLENNSTKYRSKKLVQKSIINYIQSKEYSNKELQQKSSEVTQQINFQPIEQINKNDAKVLVLSQVDTNKPLEISLEKPQKEVHPKETGFLLGLSSSYKTDTEVKNISPTKFLNSTVSINNSNNPPKSSNESKIFNEETPEIILLDSFRQLKYEYYSISDPKSKMKASIFKNENSFINTKNPKIIYKYGKLYSKIDNEKSTKYYHISADMKYPKAQVAYGIMLIKSKNNLFKNVRKGLSYLEEAANQKYTEGIGKYGYYLYTSQLDKKDKDLGLLYLKIAADEGDLFSQVKYGKSIDDKFTGHQYIKKAYENNYHGAIFPYAMNLIKGNGVEQNQEKGLDILIQLYHNDKNPKYLLYISKYLKEHDAVESIKYMKLFADSNYKDIKLVHQHQYYYGLELFKGDIIPQNYEEAADYFIKSDQNVIFKKDPKLNALVEARKNQLKTHSDHLEYPIKQNNIENSTSQLENKNYPIDINKQLVSNIELTIQNSKSQNDNIQTNNKYTPNIVAQKSPSYIQSANMKQTSVFNQQGF